MFAFQRYLLVELADYHMVKTVARFLLSGYLSLPTVTSQGRMEEQTGQSMATFSQTRW